ncbi:phage protein Gp27 family protein [Propionispora vibrioides]|uniref:DUF3486 family protein n=1 Tax=Propionispora vibrioides TaxID=112903 RepID=A0A1H8U4R1_9FIRM|nr:phage protein Gp27 family protein [Propionispora vibrioides]SEO98161.1 Protein of unknown function [Propionispora vibrioides]
MAKDRRRHSKITSILPAELVEAINRRLVAGDTYQQITEFINKAGHDVSMSSVGRYGKDFLSRLERLRIVKEQAKAIVTDTKDGPATELAEASNQLALQKIMEYLMKVDTLDGSKATEVFKALALLQRANVQVEKLKLDYNRGIDAASEKIKAALKEELAREPELIARLSDMVDAVAEEVRQK